jgi:hypothetical protein
MVRITGPLFSLKASGELKENVTYSERITGPQVRFQRKQKDIGSEAQLLQREKYSKGVILWRSMPKEERDYWIVVASQGFVDI